MSPVKECALQHNIPVYQPVRARDEAFVEEMRALNPDVMVVIAFGTDPAKEPFGAAEVWLCQHSCIPAAEIPRSSTDPVGSH